MNNPLSFLSEVSDPRATHNCWAYQIGDRFRSNDDGEPSGTAGKPIQSPIASSGIDRIMVVVIRFQWDLRVRLIFWEFCAINFSYFKFRTSSRITILEKDNITIVTFKVDFESTKFGRSYKAQLQP